MCISVLPTVCSVAVTQAPRGSPVFEPNVIETRGLVPVTRLSPYLVALFRVTVIHRCAVYVASVHLGEVAYLQTMLVTRLKPRRRVGGLHLDWDTLLKIDPEEPLLVRLNENGH